MIVSQSAGAVQGSLGDLWFVVLQYVPMLIAAIIVFIVGWIVGVILYRIIVELVKVLRIDDVMKSAGLNEAAKDVGFKLDTGRFLGTLVMWFVILGFLGASLQILGLTTVTIVLEQVVLLYLPHVIIAVLILILAAVVAEVVRKLVAGSARAAGSRHGNFAGTVAKWAIWIFAIMTVLTQLGIGADFINTLFTGFVIAMAIAVGIAFGLGGKDAAARAIEHIRSEMAHDD
jgi:mechanosensitive ion channel-like protein